MRLAPRPRRLLLALHLLVSVGWVGAVLAYLVLGITASKSARAESIRAAWTGMELIGWFALAPLAVATLATGVVMSVGTKWGLLRYYWVAISLVLTTTGTGVLLLHMPDVSAVADVSRDPEQAHRLPALGGDLLHGTLGLALLVSVLVLNVMKPPGLTRYGWRRQQDRSAGERG